MVVVAADRERVTIAALMHQVCASVNQGREVESLGVVRCYCSDMRLYVCGISSFEDVGSFVWQGHIVLAGGRVWESEEEEFDVSLAFLKEVADFVKVNQLSVTIQVAVDALEFQDLDAI